MSINFSKRAENEIRHGKHLASGETELIWGWGSPAGQRRASRRATLIAQAARLTSGVKALEIGCGTGLFTEFFAEAEANIIAVDISPDLLAIAKERGLPEDQVQFLCKRFEEFGTSDLFDAVIGSSVLHHLEVESALEIIYRLLKPGGVVVFAEPNLLNPQVFAERTFLRRWLKYISPDEIAFVRWSIQSLLEQAGFSEIRIIPFDWLHPAIPRKFIELTSSLGYLLEKTPGIREFAGSLLIEGKRPEA